MMHSKPSSANTLVLVGAWLTLVMLTLASLGVGQSLHGSAWLTPVIAAIIWLKCTLIARHFIEAHHAHVFIQWALRIFIAFVPLWLLLTGWLGERIAAWTTL